MMLRSDRLLVLLVVAVLGSLCWPAHCDAQRLFRRIQGRVQARIEAAEAAAAAAEKQAAEAAAAEQRRRAGEAGDEDSDDESPLGRRLRPLQPIDGDSPTLASPQSPSSQAPRAGNATAGGYGSSVLASGNPPSMGIKVTPSDEDLPGLVVAEIEPHSLADEAGLQVGDVMIALEGMPTFSAAMVAKQLEKQFAGDRVRVRIVRDGKPQELRIPLVDVATVSPPSNKPQSNTPPSNAIAQRSPTLPNDPTLAAGGMTLRELGVELSRTPNRRGVVISEVQPNTPAATAGLRSGDRIVSIDGRMVTTTQTLQRELATVAPGSTLSMRLVRGNALVDAEIGGATSNPSATSDVAAASETTDSALGGLGSVIGGFFGGSTPSKTEQASAVEQASGQKPA